MDYSQFLHMREELSLVVVLLLLFLADLFMSPDAHKNDGKARLNTMFPVILMAIHTAINLIPGTAADIFGGMYHYVPMHTVIKSILNVGTLIVFLMAHEWMKREDTSFKQGEFYVLTLSTLFGMYLMISAGHFLMFFIGLETASVPMAALIAFDKYRHNSAEAGAKYILTALFSSALLLFGLSMIYGSAGTLYFDDLPAHIDGNPLQIMAFVFFFTGMAFKLSLVPFHLWTADVYEGAPSTVTAYLSVVSKGSAAFVLLTILIKVFAPMINDWQEVLYWVTIASITIANIFAIRQQNLKRLMAFSSISQAGYIMLGVIGGTAQGMTALVYYVLVYAAANLGVFAVITIVALRSQKFTLEDYAGLYKKNPKIKAAVDFITGKQMMKIGCKESLERLQKELIGKDWFMTFLDFDAYKKAKDKALAAYTDQKEWAKKMLVNIAEAGYFSSDRTIEQYNRDIWKLTRS